MFVSSYRDSCLIRICSLESHKKKKEKKKTNPKGISVPRELQQRHLQRRNRSHANPLAPSMQIACRWVDIHYPARLWLDMKLSCCLHQL